MFTANSTLTISMWKDLSLQINYYFSIFLILFGCSGNLLNTFVLSQRTLRSNPCAWLFLSSSIFNLISILFGLTTRFFSISMLDRIDRNDFLCQLRVFILVTSRTIATWLILLAVLDRWLLSMVDSSLRRLSHLKNAQRGMIFITLLSLWIYSPIFYCYRANLTDSPLKCYSKTIACRILIDQIYTFYTSLTPLVLMISFSFLTISNVRKVHSRAQIPLLSRSSINSTIQEHRQRLRTIDRHLLIMLLIQISFHILFTLPQAIEMIYLTITTNQLKSSSQKAIEHSIFKFTLLLAYLASGMPFYVYTLSGGRIFRQAVFQFIGRFNEKLTCQKK